METDKIKGLSISADDYMTKPFSVSGCWRACGSAGAPRGQQGLSARAGQMTHGVGIIRAEPENACCAEQRPSCTQSEFQVMETVFASRRALVRKILEGGDGALISATW